MVPLPLLLRPRPGPCTPPSSRHCGPRWLPRVPSEPLLGEVAGRAGPRASVPAAAAPERARALFVHLQGGLQVFAEFLTDEIKEERKIQKHKSLPKMSADWELDVQGTEAKLIRDYLGRGSQSHSISTTVSRRPLMMSHQRDRKPKNSKSLNLRQPQTFVVEVVKDNTKKALVLDCHYPEDEVGQEEEDKSDIFSIWEVSFQPTSDSEWKCTNYTLNTDSLDWSLYDHLMDVLADRGVENTFADELIELSTALQHQEYINFLEDLKGFVKCL